MSGASSDGRPELRPATRAARPLPARPYRAQDRAEASYRFEGERFRARQKGVAAADWLVVGPDGTATLDVRATLDTHDGALVLLRYGGRRRLAGPRRCAH